MTKYTMFLSNGMPARPTVLIQRLGWDFLVTAAPASPPVGSNPAHELTHVVQQRELSAAWVRRGSRVIRGSAGSDSARPEVGDEVLVTFANGGPRHGAIVFTARPPSPTSGFDRVPAKFPTVDSGDPVLDLGAGGMRAVRIQIRAAGSAAFSLVGVTAADPAFHREVRAAQLM